MWPALAGSLASPPQNHPHRLREMLDDHGGFTIRVRSGEPIASGISVGTRPSPSVSFARGAWSDLVVDQWVKSAATQPLWRSSSIGGWIDPSSGTVWLDTVRVVPAPFRAFAVLLGRLSNQQCVRSRSGTDRASLMASRVASLQPIAAVAGRVRGWRDARHHSAGRPASTE